MNTVGTKIASNSELEIFIQSERQSRNSSTTSVPSDVRKTLFSKFRKKFRSPEPRPVREMKLAKNEMIKPKLSGPTLSVQDIRCVNLICAQFKSFSVSCQTKFSVEEVKRLYRAFKQVCPDGVSRSESFRTILSEIFPLGDVSKYSHLVFSSLDEHQTGTYLSFRHLSQITNTKT